MKTKHTRGFPFKQAVNDNTFKLVIINDVQKIVIDSSEVIDGVTYLSVPVTSGWISGPCKYQLQDANGVVEEGDFLILQNYALDSSSTYKSYWQSVFDAVEAAIAGRATETQLSVSVGDKRIQYCTLDELLSLRNFAKERLAEEKTRKEGSKNTLKVIDFKWSNI